MNYVPLELVNKIVSMSQNLHHRILVSILTPSGERLAEFSECILNSFGFKDEQGCLNVQLKENKLMLSSGLLPDREGQKQIVIKHPIFCPMHHLPAEAVETLPQETRTRGVDVGVAIILESCDEKILLTRRASHLSIFPGIWVPPGGHLEENESLFEAGLRELKEETGLRLEISHFSNHHPEILGLWESVYPPMLTLGSPNRHHIVVYYHTQLKPGMTAAEMEKLIHFDPAEVDACAWLSKEMISSIVEAKVGDEALLLNNRLPDVIRALVLDENQQQKLTNISASPFYSCLSSDLTNKERVSTGTKFALQLLLKN